ncbi:MAG: ATP-dependent DNA ligase [Edaphobacter sp.]|uniref:ATP-dependent DNA ligase n=1 Tax=Edaphobacter sp. TaxID=1934404 RepID=UPI00238434B8|nr:ATP-dependent DNA ligase [Edaphobacter sp.]MDE1176811.1 ATP-dependent DNA ligase [Edaphobacter sp.]
MALFHKIAELAEQLAAEPGKLKKRTAIAAAIRRVHDHADNAAFVDAGRFALYLAGTPFAEADPRKLNAGGALLSKALLAVSGATQVALTAAYRRHGDIGAAAYDLLAAKNHPGSQLTLSEMAEAFAAMATAKTTAIRSALLEGLLERTSPLEAKYLLKLVAGDMRIGVKQSLVEEAIAEAASVPVAAVRNAVMLEADLAFAAERAFAGTLDAARMRLFHPLGFMLASPVDSPEEAAERFAEKPAGKKKKPASAPEGEAPAAQPAAARNISAYLEDKYDGMRAQVHCGDPTQPSRVAIYSRNREDVTESYPELEEAFAKVGDAVTGPLIFDGEILGWDFATGRALPFAVLGQRIGRKRVSNEWRRQVPVVFMAFDLMFANGTLLLDLPLSERRNRLEAVIEKLVEQVRSPIAIDEHAKQPQSFMFTEPEEESVERLLLSPSRLVESAEDIDRAYAEARARANEGVMLKAAGSQYLPGRRGLAWMKLKRELATLDVVVTGAEFGHGRRAGILSDYTFAVRDAAGELKNVGKAYSGLTDSEIASMSEWMMQHTLEDQGYFRTVEPLTILEVAFNNIMRSDRHASGFALRFPRIVRIRDDKPLDEIDTIARVEEIYQSQVDKPTDKPINQHTNPSRPKHKMQRPALHPSESAS